MGRRLVAIVLSCAALSGGSLGAQQPGSAPPATANADALRPVAGLSSPSGPRILRLPSPAPGIVALRLSVPIVEAPIEAGSAQVLAILARARLTGLIAPLGIQADVQRTPWGLAYTVAGPSTDFDYLAFVLREVTSLPELSRVEEARTLLRREIVRLQETGRGRVELGLRESAAGATPPITGTAATVEAISPGGIRELWVRTHRRDQMTLLVSGEVSDQLLLASLDRLGTTDPGTEAPFTAPVPPGPRPQALDLLRTSGGVAWVAPEPLSPEAALAAALLTESMRQTATGFEARVSLWESNGHSTLALIGAAFQSDLRRLRSWLTDGLSLLSGELTDQAVAETARALRGDVLFGARTPVGQVQLVGRFVDAGLPADAARAYLDRLVAMDAAGVRGFLTTLQQSDPYRMEITR